MKNLYFWKKPLSVALILFMSVLGACVKSSSTQSSNHIKMHLNFSRAIYASLGDISVDQLFINVMGDGIKTQSKALTTNDSPSVDFAIDAGANRQIKVMAFVSFKGTDFVSTTGFKFISGQSESFEISAGASKECTSVPTSSPDRIRTMFPAFRLNTSIGRRLSMHSEIAVESITFKPRFSTSM